MAFAEIGNVSRAVALVTGGASGLGRATAARLARQVTNGSCVCEGVYTVV